MLPQSNKSKHLDRSNRSIKSDKDPNSPEIISKINVYEVQDSGNLSKDKLSAVQNKSKYNLSIHRNTKIKNTSICANQSYFHDEILKSKYSFRTNTNNPNPEVETHISKLRQTYRSKTCQDSKQPNIVILSPKMKTKQQRVEHNISQISNKHYKSFILNSKPCQIDTYKIEKPLSKISSIKYQSQCQLPYKKQRNSSQKQFLNDKMAKSQHGQFYKKLSILINRNQGINSKYRQVETDFEIFNQQSKRELQIQLNQIYNMRETMTKQYNQRVMKINNRTKTYCSKVNQEIQRYPSRQSRNPTLNKQISLRGE